MGKEQGCWQIQCLQGVWVKTRSTVLQKVVNNRRFYRDGSVTAEEMGPFGCSLHRLMPYGRACSTGSRHSFFVRGAFIAQSGWIIMLGFHSSWQVPDLGFNLFWTGRNLFYFHKHGRHMLASTLAVKILVPAVSVACSRPFPIWFGRQ